MPLSSTLTWRVTSETVWSLDKTSEMHKEQVVCAVSHLGGHLIALKNQALLITAIIISGKLQSPKNDWG